MSEYGKKWEHQRTALQKAALAVSEHRIDMQSPAAARKSVKQLLTKIEIWEGEEHRMANLD